jgi:hypothetical protein
VHEPAIANGSEQEGKSEIETEYAGAQVALVERYRMAGTEGDVVIDAAIFAEGHLTFGAAIKVIEDRTGHPALGDGAEIRDADNARRGDGSGRLSHFGYTKAGSSDTGFSSWPREWSPLDRPAVRFNSLVRRSRIYGNSDTRC